MLDFKLICVNILSRETCFLCLRGPSPLYCASRVGSSRCPAAMYFKAALCSHNIVIRISELRACACVVLCRAEQVFRLRIGHNAVGSGWELAVDLDQLGHASRTPGCVCRSLLSDEKLLQQVGWVG